MYFRNAQFCLLILIIITVQIFINVTFRYINYDQISAIDNLSTVPFLPIELLEENNETESITDKIIIRTEKPINKTKNDDKESKEKESFLDEDLVKKGIKEDIKNERADEILISKIDESVKYAYDPDDSRYSFDYSKSHPFDNQCRYPVIRHDDDQLSSYSAHYRETDCTKVEMQSPLVHQHRNGEILIARPNRYKQKGSFKCYFKELSGTLRKSRIKEVGNWTELPIGKRILIQKDQFIIQCLNKTDDVIYLNAFAWISDKPHLSPPDISGDNQKYSIAMLIIDSTSRNQFYRHMPLTLKFLKERDFKILTGYNKIGDNSAINLITILSGLIYGRSGRGFTNLIDDDPNAAFDFNSTHADFSNLNISLIKRAKNAGCVTLWNDEIANPNYGLFHYYDFKGFEHPISNYYYRPYYQYIYKNLNATTGCYNGRPYLPKWLELWEQFSTKYSNKCHFSFNFLTGLTHASSSNLELYDVPVSDALLRMESAKVFDNTFVIVMGDHGQRISPIQKSSIGRIEERMSFFSIHVPEKFKKKYPKKYENLIRNQNRFTSNFDVHETLDEIVSKTLNEEVQQTKRHGISLFSDIPKNRSCHDALVPDNFCTCMDKLDKDIPKVKNLELLLKNKLTEYLNKTKDSCISELDFTISSTINWYSISKMVRAGIRFKEVWDKLENKDIKRELFDIEFTADIRMKINNQDEKAELLTRIQYNSKKKTFQINAPPYLKSKKCPNNLIINNVCGCYNSKNA